MKEHELIGWMLTMYFLSALEVIAYAFFLDSKGDYDPQNSFVTELLTYDTNYNRYSHPSYLPPPMTITNTTKPFDDPIKSLLYGTPLNNHHDLANQPKIDSSSSTPFTPWIMNPVHCTTTFEPILHSTLSSHIISGSTEENLHWNIVRGPLSYHQGWVMDLSSKERAAKRNLERFGGLGFVDAKKAYYGIKASGVLKVFLPWKQQQQQQWDKGEYNHKNENVSDLTATYRNAEDAHHYFRSLVVCEVNENRGQGECVIAHDATFTVGGIAAQNVTMIDAIGVNYLGKKICANVGIPEGAVVSKNINQMLGLELDMQVTSNKVSLKLGACSVSHIIWEQTYQPNIIHTS